MSLPDIAGQAMALRHSILTMKTEIDDLRNDARGKCELGIRRSDEIKVLYDVKASLRKQRDVAVKNNDSTTLLTAENRLADVRRQIRTKKQDVERVADQLMADKDRLEAKAKQYYAAKKQYNDLFV